MQCHGDRPQARSMTGCGGKSTGYLRYLCECEVAMRVRSSDLCICINGPGYLPADTDVCLSVSVRSCCVPRRGTLTCIKFYLLQILDIKSPESIPGSHSFCLVKPFPTISPLFSLPVHLLSSHRIPTQQRFTTQPRHHLPSTWPTSQQPSACRRLHLDTR